MASVELNWTDNSGDETGFPIYRSTTSSPSFPADYTKIDTAAADAISYTDTTAASGTAYTYAVTAENGDGESAETTNSITTTAATTAQSAGLDSASLLSASFDSSASAGPTSATAAVGSLASTANDPGASIPTQAAGDVTRGLVSKWKLDGDATDSVGTNDGTASNVTYTGGYIDQAGSFNASTSMVDCGNDASLNQPSWTYATWVNLDATSSGTSDIRVLGSKNAGYNDRMFWLVSWDGEWQARVGSNAQTVNGGPSATGTWTHLALRYDGGTNTFSLFVDGVLKDTNTESTLGGQGSPLRIGAEAAGDRVFDGLIDEARMYDVVLTDAEIADLYAYDGSAAPVSLNVTANIGSLSGSFASSAFSPGPTSVGGETPSATASAEPSTATPGPVEVGSETAAGSVAGGDTEAAGGPVSLATDGGTVVARSETPTATPGPVSALGETAVAATSGSSGSVTPYGVQLTGSPATGSLAAPSSALVPGPVSATSTVGVVSVQGLSGFVVSQDGTVIYADPGLLGSSAPSPTPLSGPVSVAGQAAQLAASATFGSVVPDTIQVNGAGATGSLAASGPALIPGPLSAVSDPGSVLATAPGSGLVAGPASVSGDTASMSLAALLAHFGADGVILADLASGSLFAGFDGLSPGPVSASADSGSIGASTAPIYANPGPAPLFAEIATSTAVVSENPVFSAGKVDFAADLADMAALASESGFSVGTAPISADLVDVALSVPAGWSIQSFLAARRARATGDYNGLDLSGSLTGSDAAGSSENSVDVRERD